MLMHARKGYVLLASAAVLCSCTLGGGADPVTPPPTVPDTGRFILQSAEGRLLPAPVTYCNPSCSGTRLVFADTFQVSSGSPMRFSWNVSFAEDSTSARQRIVVIGTLISIPIGYSLSAENHPILPQNLISGLFYRTPTGSYELRAHPPWRGSGLTLFALLRLSN